MDHTRLAQINRRNAQTAKILGNRKMSDAYSGLARFHENKAKEAAKGQSLRNK